MSKETQIKSVIEEYLNLETTLNDYAREKEAYVKRYDHLLSVHDLKHRTYDIHSAAPVIGAYDDIKDLEIKTYEASRRYKELGEKIKGFIRALNGRPLDVRFMFDELNHRAGVHTFYLEEGELRTTHAPAS